MMLFVELKTTKGQKKYVARLLYKNPNEIKLSGVLQDQNMTRMEIMKK